MTEQVAAIEVEPKAEKPKPTANRAQRGRGGRGARSRRMQTRREQTNPVKQTEIQNEARTRLGLEETQNFTALKPASSVRPGGVHVNLLGFSENISVMLTRMRSIAIRPLAILLTDANVLIYRKISLYIANARIVAAQDTVPAVAGNPLDMAGTVTSDQFRYIEGKTKVIPNYMSWLLMNIGVFELDGVKCVPLLQINGFNAVMNCNFQAVLDYVAQHVGEAIPEDEIPSVERLAQILPNLRMTAAHRFNNHTRDFWLPITPDEWSIFTEINAALAEQKMCTADFSLMAATGSPQAIVRFPTFVLKDEVAQYYCTQNVTPSTEKIALCLRSGVDEFLQPARRRDRFIGNPATATLSGNDSPGLFIGAQLQMLSKLSTE